MDKHRMGSFECGFIILFVVLFALLSKEALLYEFETNLAPQKIRTLSEFSCEIGWVTAATSLPRSFENLPPRTEVKLRAEIMPNKGDCLYVKSVYAPFQLYVNEQLIYASGDVGSYPDFLMDPPTLLSIVPLPETETPLRLRLEYLSPTQRTVLTAHPLLLGSSSAIFYQLYSQYMFSFLLSIILIFLGIVAILVSAVLLRKEATFSSFLWLGIFSCATGMWILGECNLTAFFIPYPAFLYTMAFVGLFSLEIPLLKFGLLSLNLHHKKWLKITLTLLQCLLLGAMVLQLFGLVSFARSMYLFHIIMPPIMLLFSGYILWDALRFKNPMARRFLFPMSALAFTMTLDLLNYQFRFTNNLTLFFQLGALIFILLLGGIGAYFVRDAMRVKEAKKRLEFELTIKKQQIDLQKSHHTILLQNAAAIKAQRHDLRHQLAVIRHYNDTDDRAALDDYLNELLAKIPIEKNITFCENPAVNAVALYYATLAKTEDISVAIQISIPVAIGRIQDSDLCVIMGNFLENAIEACRLIENDERFIKVYAYVRYKYLIIAVDNSFNGQCTREDDRFLSQKRSGYGTGLSSVQAVAEKYDGTAKFEAKEFVFSSSVYLQM